MKGSAARPTAAGDSDASGALVRARLVQVRGIVQGVGFRPHLFRLARRHGIAGWVRNTVDGVHVRIEGQPGALDGFLHDLVADAPPAARISCVQADAVEPGGLRGFEIRDSLAAGRASTRISPDLPVCGACLRELLDPADRRYGYPYITCTDCGPRFSIVRQLPYDRPTTTMAAWTMCEACAREYESPGDRRFHAQPIACEACGPHYLLIGPPSSSRPVVWSGGTTAAARPAPAAASLDAAAIRRAAALLREGRIVAIKGIGGYHLACDAANAAAVEGLRARKFRKEKPFALMVSTVEEARALVELSADGEDALTSPARPIVLAPARREFEGVAPGNHDLGVMLPYAPLHHLVFASGAPSPLVMTSGNRSSEPIAYEDEDARTRLDGIADAFVVGERPIARRLDDSIVRADARGPVVLRRSRGLAPAVVAACPSASPVLAVGGDLKNSVTLVVGGEACMGPHAGDLEHHAARQAFHEGIQDLLSMYDVDPRELIVAHDAHPAYASTAHARALPARAHVAVQHHRAHVASVLAERGDLDRRVLGIALDGTGYGDDGGIWGGEFFVGSVRGGFERVARLRPASLPGGDAAARHPVQAAAGFLADVDADVELGAPPFRFPPRFDEARRLIARGVRVFGTTSAGRLFDTVAALLGFTRPITFEGQAAIWLEQLARGAAPALDCAFPFDGHELDWRPALARVIEARRAHLPLPEIAAGVHAGLARGLAEAAATLLDRHAVETIVLSGGVFQNARLLECLHRDLGARGFQVWTNHAVPPNDGGLSLGQAALAAMRAA